jgi:Ca2+-binding RTX toxin-like protein
MINGPIHVPLTVTACVGLLLLAASPARADHSPEPPPPCTIVGTPDNDVLQGGAGDDVMCGLGGDDVIVGQDGDDVLLGGPGDDLLVGGAGSDQLHGDDGDDQLFDTSGSSTEDGGAGVDLCVAATGSTVTNCERTFTLPGRATGL